MRLAPRRPAASAAAAPLLPAAPLRLIAPGAQLRRLAGLALTLAACGVQVKPRPVVQSGVALALHRGEGWAEALGELVSIYGGLPGEGSGPGARGGRRGPTRPARRRRRRPWPPCLRELAGGALRGDPAECAAGAQPGCGATMIEGSLLEAGLALALSLAIVALAVFGARDEGEATTMRRGMSRAVLLPQRSWGHALGHGGPSSPEPELEPEPSRILLRRALERRRRAGLTRRAAPGRPAAWSSWRHVRRRACCGARARRRWVIAAEGR